jgi:hypothetical protein
MEVTIREKEEKKREILGEINNKLTVIDELLLFGNRSNELKEKMNINWFVSFFYFRASEMKFNQ